MCFQGDHIRLWANAFCAVFPGSSSLESQRGIQRKTKFLKGMIALQAQSQKFSVSPFSKGDDLRRFLKAAVKGGKSYRKNSNGWPWKVGSTMPFW
jgi:hypothetical protein